MAHFFYTSHSEARMAGMYQGGGGIAKLEALIRDLADFLPQISELPPQQFDLEIRSRVREINTLSHAYPERRELLKKICFDLCAYALDQSALLWRIRHKPSGYGGDVETLEMIYTGETHSQGVGKAWDAFIFRQGSLEIVAQRQKLLRDALREKCTRQENVSVLSIAAHVRDFLQVAKFAPDCARRTLFYCLELETKAITHYKKLLAGYEDLNVQWDTRDLATLSLERNFDLIWLPRSLLYLNDEAVVVLIRKLWNLLSTNGTLLVVAVQPSDAQVLLEWCTGWTLYGRTPETMKALFLQAGIDRSAVRFDGAGWWLGRM
jgi:Nodulation protein S (NodS)